MSWDSFFSSIGGAFEDFGGLVAGGFSDGFSLTLGAGRSVGDQIANGAAIVITSTEGGFGYVVDFSKTSAAQTQGWVTSATGDVRDFSIEAYQEAKDVGIQLLNFILQPATPPQLGPYNPAAREVMKHLFSEYAASSWERDAISKGYTMAFDFRGTASLPAIAATAFSGIYVDNSGQWGFFAGAGVGGSISLNVAISFELWMLFGGRDKYSSPCYMPGLTISIRLPDGGAATLGGNVIVSQSWSFLGFRITTGVTLLPATYPVTPDTGPPQTTMASTTLAKRGPSYSAGISTGRDSTNEGAVLASAARATLPFVLKPDSYFYIQSKCSKKVIDMPNGGTGDIGAQQLVWRGGQNQRFRFQDAGSNCFYIIPQTGGGKVIDVYDGSGDDGASVLQYSNHAGDNQKFQVVLAKDGWFYLIARHSGLALDVARGDAADGVEIIQWSWHGGDNQKFRFIEAQEQDNWRYCKKCHALFFAGIATSSCAAGGNHDGTGSGAYVLFCTAPEDVDNLDQDHWRWCSKCMVLHYARTTGKCPKDGQQHSAQGSANYAVISGTPPNTYANQDGWRWCQVCSELCYGGLGASVCPNGGGHNFGGTNYILKHT